MSTNVPLDPAAAAAEAAAAATARSSLIQLWTLFSIGVSVTILRTYARSKAVGMRNLRADDFLVWIAILFYSTQTALAHSVGSVAHGLANNGITDAERAALSPDDPEYQMSIVLGAGIFVLVCAMLKTIFVTVDPVNGAQLAGQWGTVEAFVAVFTTNLPMIFPLFKTWLTPLLRSSSRSYKMRSGFNTIGGGSGSGGSVSAGRKRNMRGGPPSVNPLTNISLNNSQEQIVRGIPLKELEISGAPAAPGHSSNVVYVSKEFDLTTEDGGARNGEQKIQRTYDRW
ncbi:hypothetical protein UCREL1_9373 [Eutypa lata UCREL1]|uniref:Integral membrane protein n=1 Tax=Eutypa lata (strain UCR-EL1) TaxID=1287681 RepID=M7T1K2_EUTLA|nr:hypothetical protein UCREL1_9373 [Eutypa lata UCREL1]